MQRPARTQRVLSASRHSPTPSGVTRRGVGFSYLCPFPGWSPPPPVVLPLGHETQRFGRGGPPPPPPPPPTSPLLSSPCCHCSFLPADPPAAPSLRRPFVSCAGAGRGRVCHDDSRLQGQVRGGDPGPPEPHGECPWPSVLNLQRTNSASVVPLRGVSAVALTPPPSFFLLLFLLLVRETGRGEGERRDQRDGGVQARARGPGGLIAAPEPIDCPDKSPSRRPCLQMSE